SNRTMSSSMLREIRTWVVSLGHSIVSELVESPRHTQPTFGSSTSSTTNCPSRTRATSSSRRRASSSPSAARPSIISALLHGVESAPSNVTPFGRRVPTSCATAAQARNPPAASHTRLLLMFLSEERRDMRSFRQDVQHVYHARLARDGLGPLVPRGRAFHHFGENPIGRRPGLPRLRCELVAEPFLERPEQRRADRLVVRRSHPVPNVAAAEILDRGHERAEVAQVRDDRADHRSQLAPLALQIAREQRLERRVELEQARVKHRRGLLCDRHDLEPALAHEVDLLRCHSAVSFRSGRAALAEEEPDQKRSRRSAPFRKTLAAALPMVRPWTLGWRAAHVRKTARDFCLQEA